VGAEIKAVQCNMLDQDPIAKTELYHIMTVNPVLSFVLHLKRRFIDRKIAKVNIPTYQDRAVVSFTTRYD
jgi:hypothetical protein